MDAVSGFAKGSNKAVHSLQKIIQGLDHFGNFSEEEASVIRKVTGDHLSLMFSSKKKIYFGNIFENMAANKTSALLQKRRLDDTSVKKVPLPPQKKYLLETPVPQTPSTLGKLKSVTTTPLQLPQESPPQSWPVFNKVTPGPFQLAQDLSNWTQPSLNFGSPSALSVFSTSLRPQTQPIFSWHQSETSGSQHSDPKTPSQIQSVFGRPQPQVQSTPPGGKSLKPPPCQGTRGQASDDKITLSSDSESDSVGGHIIVDQPAVLSKSSPSTPSDLVQRTEMMSHYQRVKDKSSFSKSVTATYKLAGRALPEPIVGPNGVLTLTEECLDFFRNIRHDKLCSKALLLQHHVQFEKLRKFLENVQESGAGSSKHPSYSNGRVILLTTSGCNQQVVRVGVVFRPDTVKHKDLQKLDPRWIDQFNKENGRNSGYVVQFLILFAGATDIFLEAHDRKKSANGFFDGTNFVTRSPFVQSTLLNIRGLGLDEAASLYFFDPLSFTLLPVYVPPLLIPLITIQGQLKTEYPPPLRIPKKVNPDSGSSSNTRPCASSSDSSTNLGPPSISLSSSTYCSPSSSSSGTDQKSTQSSRSGSTSRLASVSALASSTTHRRQISFGGGISRPDKCSTSRSTSTSATGPSSSSTSGSILSSNPR